MGEELTYSSDPLSFFDSTDYSIIEKIGEGGFGKVYKGQNNNTGQHVAIKFLTLDPNLKGEKRKRYIDRFERETFLNSQLQHPNIVRLLDKGRCNEDLIFAVFEYVEGETLKNRLFKAGPLSPTETAEIMSQVLDALVHAHNQGIVHRDIKPANIMLSQIGATLQAKILDFGIGTLTDRTQQQDYKSITLTQETLGTPSYSAPEQLRGEPPTAKTDLYVWGLVFIECLTGEPTVSGSTLASIFQKQLSPNNIPLPSGIVSHPIAALLRRVLNKKIEERAGDALEIYQSLKQINLANLVGELKKPSSNEFSEIEKEDSNTIDKTLVAEDSILHSGFKEQKQITAMCVTLNTKFSSSEQQKYDQATNKEVIQALHQDQKNLTIDIALRFGGYHAGTLGDTVLFYFGYPITTDNDSRLCARASLELLSQLNRRNALLEKSQGIISSAQIGIHSGLIPIYKDTLPEGETPNLAMALSRKAQTNQIICSSITKKMLDNYIEFESTHAFTTDIFANKIPLHKLVGEKTLEAFGFLRSANQKHLFIGREQELATLTESLKIQRATASHIFGEAGIGKSRLLQEFRNHAKTHNHFIAQCLPEYQNNAVFPILRLIESLYNLSFLTNSDKLALFQKIACSTDEKKKNESRILVLSNWFDLEPPKEIGEQELSPDESKNILFDCLVELLYHDSICDSNKTNLFVIEDLHWADPITIKFIQKMVESEAFINSKSTLLSSSRKELPQELEAIFSDNIELKHLEKPDTQKFIHALFDHQDVSKQVLDLLLSRTDGIPLFIEEFTGMLKQKQWVDHINGRIDLVESISEIEIPSNLRDSLQQKLDYLKQGKETAQLASTIGREFNYELLKHSARCDDAQLQLDLEELIKFELIYLQRRVSGDSYIFKHALVRDAAYDSMIKPLRVQSHKQIAQAYEDIDPHAKDQNSAVVAMHWSQGEEYKKAVEYGSVAANNALKRSSAQEAINQAEKNKEWISQVFESDQEDFQLANNATMISAYMELKGWASEEVRELSEYSANILRKRGEFNQLVSNLWWDVLNGVVGGHVERTEKTFHELEACFGKVNALEKAAIRCAQAFHIFSSGSKNSYPKSRELLYQSLEFFNQSKDHLEGHEQVYGFNIGVFARALLAQSCCVCNDIAEAEDVADTGLALAREVENIPSIGIALMHSAELYTILGNKEKTRLYANELVELAKQYDLAVYGAYAQMQMDWADDNFENEEETLQLLQSGGSLFALAHYQSLYVETYIAEKQYQQALIKIEECLQIDNDILHHYYVPKLIFLKAVCKKELGLISECEILKRDSIESGKQTGASYYIDLAESL